MKYLKSYSEQNKSCNENLTDKMIGKSDLILSGKPIGVKGKLYL